MTVIQRITTGQAVGEEETSIIVTLTAIFTSITATTMNCTRGQASGNLIGTRTSIATVTTCTETTMCLSMTIDAMTVIRFTTKETLTSRHVAEKPPDMTPLISMITGTYTKMMLTPTADEATDTLMSQSAGVVESDELQPRVGRSLRCLTDRRQSLRRNPSSRGV